MQYYTQFKKDDFEYLEYSTKREENYYLLHSKKGLYFLDTLTAQKTLIQSGNLSQVEIDRFFDFSHQYGLWNLPKKSKNDKRKIEMKLEDIPKLKLYFKSDTFYFNPKIFPKNKMKSAFTQNVKILENKVNVYLQKR